MREDAYTRIALRLRDVGAEDREWLLSQLGAEDCQRVSAALQEYRARNGGSAEATGPKVSHEAPKGQVEPKAPVENGNPATQPAARLAGASAADVRKVLAGQPDWAIALVLSAGPWPWGQEVLGQLSPERIRALRALASELSQRVKPQLRDAVIRVVALKMAPPEIQTPVTQAFDTALQRAVQDLSGIDSLKLTAS